MPTPPTTPIQFYLSRKAKLAYLQIPKAGCTSMRAAFCKIDRPEIPEAELLKPKAFALHREWTDVVGLDEPFLSDCYRFTFVREPAERFCSFYRSKIRGRTAEQIKPRILEMGFHPGMTLLESISVAERLPQGRWDPHFAPQNYFVFDSAGRPRVEYIGKLERLAGVQDHVERSSGVRLWMPKLNVTSGSSGSSEEEPLEGEVLTRLQKFYRADYEAFGYVRRQSDGV